MATPTVYLNVPDGETVDSVWFNIPDGQTVDSIWLNIDVFDVSLVVDSAYIAGSYGVGYVTVKTNPTPLDFDPVFEVEALTYIYGIGGSYPTSPQRRSIFVYKQSEDNSSGWTYQTDYNRYFLPEAFYQVTEDTERLIRVRVINPETGEKSSWASATYTTEGE